MPRKWNPCFIDEDPGFIEVDAAGTVRRGLRFTYCDEDVEMIRQGYKCIECGEVMPEQEAAFPTECPVCGFRIRQFQQQAFDVMFAGWRPTGSNIDWDDEMGRLERQREERERAEGLRAKGIFVPRGLG